MSKFLTRKELDALLSSVEQCNDGDGMDTVCKAYELADRLVDARVDTQVIQAFMYGRASVSWDEDGTEHWRFCE